MTALHLALTVDGYAPIVRDLTIIGVATLLVLVVCLIGNRVPKKECCELSELLLLILSALVITMVFGPTLFILLTAG